MTVVSCVDDNFGMMFGGRRQSRDKAVYKRIVDTFGIENLKIPDYSKPLFADYNISHDNDFSALLETHDVCFVENPEQLPDISQIDKIVLYFWNRKYPFDKKLNIDLNLYALKSEIEFEGNSHDKITERIYEKK